MIIKISQYTFRGRHKTQLRSSHNHILVTYSLWTCPHNDTYYPVVGQSVPLAFTRQIKFSSLPRPRQPAAYKRIAAGQFWRLQNYYISSALIKQICPKSFWLARGRGCIRITPPYVAIVAATWGDHSMVETTRFILYEILLLETIIIHIWYDQRRDSNCLTR